MRLSSLFAIGRGEAGANEAFERGIARVRVVNIAEYCLFAYFFDKKAIYLCIVLDTYLKKAYRMYIDIHKFINQ